MLQNDCCLLSDVCLNSERISYILEYRFKRNSNQTSFDFKSFLFEQPLNNIKVYHSLLKIHPKIIESIDNDDDESTSSESSDDEIEQISSPKLLTNLSNDDYLDKLAEWEPNKSSSIVESSDEEEEIKDNIHIYSPTNIEMSSTEIEDLLVTFVHHPVKTEPIVNENIPQLDGQTDILFNNNHKKSTIERKISPSINTSIKKRRQSSSSKSKKRLPMVHTGKTLFDYFKDVKHLPKK